MFRLFLDKFGKLERLKKGFFRHFLESQTKDVHRRVNLRHIGGRVAEFRVNDRIDHQAVCKFAQALLHRQRQIADCECCARKAKFRSASIAVNDDLGNMT